MTGGTLSIPNILVTDAQVANLLASLRDSTSTGPDGIPPRVLKACYYSLTPFLTALYNNSLETGSFPEA
jgi:hypothetical protein